jgi:ABC-type phosphate transport system substrate-binding protein
MTKKALVLTVLLLKSLSADIAVVADRSFPFDRLEPEVIKKLYLQKQRYVDETRVVPLNLKSSSKLRSSFESAILGMSQGRLKQYWLERHYNGVRPPKQVGSVTSMQQYLTKVKGAIGYIDSHAVTEDMKVLYIIKN